MKLPTISLAMMVKNEEDFLEDALKSAKDWVDEMIVVDTGSTDATVAIAKSMGAKVFYFEWPNDFSKARNETIKHCSCDWIAILDADERFTGAHPERVKEILKRNEHYPYQAYMLKVINMNEGKETHSFLSQRIFPNHPDLGYTGRVHNHFGALSDPTRLIDNIQCIGLDIIHLGYDKEIFKAKKKLERNLALLEAAVKEEPEVVRYRFYLGREYILQNRLTEAESLLQSVYQQKEIEPLLRIEAGQCLLGIWKTQNKPYQSIELCIEILESNPNEIDTWFYLGEAYQSLQLEDEAIKAYEESIRSLDVHQIQTSRIKPKRGDLELIIAKYYWEKESLEKALFYYDLAFEHLPQNTAKVLSIIPQYVLIASVLNDKEKLEKTMHLLVENHLHVDINDWNLQSNQNLFFQVLQELITQNQSKLIKAILRKAKALNPMIVEDSRFFEISESIP